MSRILIAEDEPRIAAFLEKGLRSRGFTTVVATDGDEVILMAMSNSFDLLLLDLGLPVKDGWTVLEELRSQGSQLPIIILTARDDANAKVAGLEGGADDYVTKPFNFKELLARVKLRLRPSQIPRVHERQLPEPTEKPLPRPKGRTYRDKSETEKVFKTLGDAKNIKYILCDQKRLIKGRVVLNHATKTYSSFSLKIFGFGSATSQSGIFWWGDAGEIVIEFNLKYAEGNNSESLQGTLKFLDITLKDKGRWIACVRSLGQEVARAEGTWFWDDIQWSAF